MDAGDRDGDDVMHLRPSARPIAHIFQYCDDGREENHQLVRDVIRVNER